MTGYASGVGDVVDSVNEITAYEEISVYTGTNLGSYAITSKTLSNLGVTVSLKEIRFDYASTDEYFVTGKIDINTSEGYITVFDSPTTLNLLNQIDAAYHEVASNLAAYFNAVYSNNTVVNETDLVDPYMLASLLNTDVNKTGFYGYAAAELALAGLPTTGLNKTINITIYNTSGLEEKTTEGYLFTNWDTVFTVGQNYTIPAGTLVFFADDEGLWKIPENYTIHINKIVDARTGQELNETTIYRYVEHTSDATKLLEELAKLRALYQEYLNMQALLTGGGSSGNGLLDWWNSLDTTAKLGIVAIGMVAAYAYIRRK